MRRRRFYVPSIKILLFTSFISKMSKTGTVLLVSFSMINWILVLKLLKTFNKLSCWVSGTGSIRSSMYFIKKGYQIPNALLTKTQFHPLHRAPQLEKFYLPSGYPVSAYTPYALRGYKCCRKQTLLRVEALIEDIIGLKNKVSLWYILCRHRVPYGRQNLSNCSTLWNGWSCFYLRRTSAIWYPIFD